MPGAAIAGPGGGLSVRVQQSSNMSPAPSRQLSALAVLSLKGKVNKAAPGGFRFTPNAPPCSHGTLDYDNAPGPAHAPVFREPGARPAKQCWNFFSCCSVRQPGPVSVTTTSQNSLSGLSDCPTPDEVNLRHIHCMPSLLYRLSLLYPQKTLFKITSTSIIEIFGLSTALFFNDTERHQKFLQKVLFVNKISFSCYNYNSRGDYNAKTSIHK
jgi:hypothetical protein